MTGPGRVAVLGCCLGMADCCGSAARPPTASYGRIASSRLFSCREGVMGAAEKKASRTDKASQKPSRGLRCREAERFMERGGEALADVQLLAVIVHNDYRRRSSLEIAARVLERFGNLDRVRAAGVPKLRRVKGLTEEQAVRIMAALTLAEHLGREKLERGKRLSCSADVFEHFYGRLGRKRHEVVWVLLLDAHMQIRKEVRVGSGGSSDAVVSPERILREALGEGCSRLVLVHNHPSGRVKVSEDDRQFTKRVQEACRLVKLRLEDHIVIAGDEYVSMSDAGML